MSDHVERSCYYYKGHLIPGCWNAALGTGDCTCRSAKKKRDREADVDAKLAELTAAVKALRRDVDKLRASRAGAA